MDVSVIIPTLNRDRCLKNTLHDLMGQKGEFYFEMVVIDQNVAPVKSRDTELCSMSTQTHIKWVECAGKGVVYGRNKGISVAAGDILVFVDDDVEIKDSEFLAKHLKAHSQSEDNVAAICGREINIGAPASVVRLNYERKSPMSDILYFPRNYKKRIEATVLSTCNCSIRKSPLLDVQCFDENFCGASYGDDADLALRLLSKGYRIIYDPSPTLLHLLAPIGGLRFSDKMNPFSESDKVVSSIVFYLKHIHKNYKTFRFFYIYNHILRKSLFLKTNVVRPWRLPHVVIGLVQAFFTAQKYLKNGDKFSFKQKA